MGGAAYFFQPTADFEGGQRNATSVNDAYDTSKFNNGTKNDLGKGFYFRDSKGRMLKFRYVRINSTTPPASPVVGPVYWKDNTFTVVTLVSAESVAGINMVAGVLMNTNITNGNYGWIMVAGFSGAGSDSGWGASLESITSVVGGDAVIPATGATQTVARVAAGTAPTNRVIYWALTAVTSSLSDGLVAVEDF